jgi:hypothetical protein
MKLTALLLICAIAFSQSASQGPLIFQNGGTPLGAQPIFNCGTNTACTVAGNVVTIAVSGSGAFVQLQAMSPGTQQTGNANISGVFRGSEFVGSFIVSNQHALLSGAAFTFENNGTTSGFQINVGTNNTVAFLGLAGGDTATVTANALTIDGAITYNVNSPPANSVVCYKTGGVMGYATNTAGVIGTTCN